MKALRWIILFLLFGFSAGVPSLAAAGTIIVRADKTGDQPDIVSAVAVAGRGDIVLLEPGIFTGTGNLNVTINKSITITSSGGADVTIIDCRSGGFGFDIVNAGSSSIILSELTIRNASHGAVRASIGSNSGVVLIIENCIFEDCSGYTQALRIGAISSATIRGNVIQNNNILNFGAGLGLGTLSATIENNIFRNNSSINGKGGAIYCEYIGGTRTVAIRDNIFCGNNAASGGALYFLNISPGHVTVSNNTLTENSASIEGGGIYFENSAVSVSSTIIAFSSAGGAISSDGSSLGTIFTCCDIFGNAGLNGDNLVGITDGGNNIYVNPLFAGAPGMCDPSLQPESPCMPENNSCIIVIGESLWLTKAKKFVITCPDAGGIDPGNRSALVNNWVTVRVTAVNALGGTDATYTGTITLSAKGHGIGAEVDWTLASGSGGFTNGGPGDDTAAYTFDSADGGVVDLRIRDDNQDFIDPEAVDAGDITIADDDTEEYIVFTKPNNIQEGEFDVNNIQFGTGIAAYSTSLPAPVSLALISYMRGAAGGYLSDPTVTVVPYKDTPALGVKPPPNFKMMYGALALDAPYPYCNGYDIKIPGYPPSPLPAVLIITQSFDDAVLSDIEEGNIQLHHWNGTGWDILPATVSTVTNIIWTVATNLSQLSPVFITEPLPGNVFAAAVSIEPAVLNIADTGGWVYGYIELPGGLILSDMDLAAVTINPTVIDNLPGSAAPAGVAAADPGYFVIGDHDNNGTADAEIRFDRAAVVAMFTDGNPAEEFMIRGFMNDGFTFFKGYTTIATINDPTVAVLITAFRARAVEAGIELSWDIAADEGIKGFRLYRRAGANVPDRRINGGIMLPADEGRFVDTDIKNGKTYWYSLGVVKADGSEILSRTERVTNKSAVFALLQNYPNPFNPTTTISFTLPERMPTNLSIYDINGRLVRVLVDRLLDAGAKNVVWNGLDTEGKLVSSGIYFYRLRAGKNLTTRKMALVK